MTLPDEQCHPYRTGDNPLSAEEAAELALRVPRWTLAEKQIEREFKFKNFRDSMDFVNVGPDIVNQQDHHPDIFISYNRVQLSFSTHKVGGLSRNDFIVAAKIDRLLESLRRREVSGHAS